MNKGEDNNLVKSCTVPIFMVKEKCTISFYLYSGSGWWSTGVSTTYTRPWPVGVPGRGKEERPVYHRFGFYRAKNPFHPPSEWKWISWQEFEEYMTTEAYGGVRIKVMDLYLPPDLEKEMETTGVLWKGDWRLAAYKAYAQRDAAKAELGRYKRQVQEERKAEESKREAEKNGISNLKYFDPPTVSLSPEGIVAAVATYLLRMKKVTKDKDGVWGCETNHFSNYQVRDMVREELKRVGTEGIARARDEVPHSLYLYVKTIMNPIRQGHDDEQEDYTPAEQDGLQYKHPHDHWEPSRRWVVL